MERLSAEMVIEVGTQTIGVSFYAVWLVFAHIYSVVKGLVVFNDARVK